MERKDVLKLAKQVYGENDKRVTELVDLFSTAGNDITNALSEFIANEVNWSSPAPKSQIQELMDDIAKVAVNAAMDERPFVNQTFRDERMKTYGDVAKQKVNLILVQLALGEKQIVQDNLDNVDRAPEVNPQPNKPVYSRSKTEHAIRKIVGDHHPGWQGTSWQDRIYKEKAALMRQLDEQVDDVLKNHYKPQDFRKEIAAKLDSSEKRSERILRTESSGEFSRRLVDDFTQRNVKRYKIEAALSANTCKECEGLDGKEFDMDEASEGVTLPPFHPNCQCTIIEVTDDDFHVDFSKMPKYYGLGDDDRQSETDTTSSLYNGDVKVGQKYVSDKMSSGEWTNLIKTDMQQKHMESSKLPGKSYLYDTEDPQQLLNKYSGHGELQKTHAGDYKNTEIIKTDHVVGVDYRTGKETQWIKIHHSQTRTHIVPFLPKEE